MLSGTGKVRTPTGVHDVRAGDMACFPPGPAGAHQVLNPTDQPLRVVMLSDTPNANAFVYPDSDKIAFDSHDDGDQYPRRARVDYWEGE